MLFLLSLLIGGIAGLRTMTALAAAAWAMHLGRLGVDRLGVGQLGVAHGWLAILGYRWTAAILTLLAIGELVTDKLPMTPSRKTPIQFGARIVSGALCGAAIGMGGPVVVTALLGAIGAIAGTLFGAAARANLARAFVADRPAALIEDIVAILAAALVVVAL